MNLAQFSYLAHHTTGVGAFPAEYFRRAVNGGDGFTTAREAQRVAEWCGRVARVAATLGLADLVAEAEAVGGMARAAVDRFAGPDMGVVNGLPPGERGFED